MRLSQVAKILNVGIGSVVKDLSAKGFKVDMNPNAKISFNQLEILAKDYKNTELLTKAATPPPPRPEPAIAVVEPPKPSEARPAETRPAEVRPAPAPQPQAVQPAPRPAEPVKTEAPRPAATQPAAPQPVATPPAEARPVEARPAPEVKAEPAPAPAPAPRPVEAEAARPTPAPQPENRPAPQPTAAQPPVTPPAPKPAETPAPAPVAKTEAPAPKPQETESGDTSRPTVPGLKILGKIDLSQNRPSDQRRPEQQRPQGGRDNGPRNDRNGGPRENGPRGGDNRDGGSRDGGQRNFGQRPNENRPQQNRPEGQNQGPRPERQPENRPAPQPTAAQPPVTPPAPTPEAIEPELVRAQGEKLQGLRVLGKIELPVERKNNGGGSNDNREKRKRKRMRVPATGQPGTPGQGGPQGERQGGGQRDGGPREGQRSPDNRDGGQRDGQRNTGPRDGQRDNRNQPGGQPGQGQGGNRPAQNRPGGPQGQGNNAGNRPAGTGSTSNNNNRKGGERRERREEPTEREVRDQIKATNLRMAGGKSNRGADRRRDRRAERADRERERLELEQEDAKVLKVTEFVSANDLASLMDVSINEVIATCMSLGMFVSINQRLDAEAITVIADEFGYDVQFVSAEEEIEAGLVETEDAPEDLLLRAPIVTIMGHVDHGKTSLLDYIRRTKVAAGEAGGITQHIGAYSVQTDDGRPITFLDTPGHEAFTAMRARGAKVTDVVIIVIAADDSVMPQTREAINHAQVAGVPIVFAFSKVDKPGADTERIRQELAQMNMLVEEWGGKYQTQEISSKSGLGINDLLDKVLLEAELLDLKANPNKRAVGTVIEASLDKGRGYVTTMLVQSGTLRISDVVLVGAHFGRIRAMTDSFGKRLKEAGPSTPVQVLGLPGAPQAGDRFNVMETEREAREIANKREQLLREQSLRTRKHITLEEIGRRKAIGSFKELNVIVKGDVDGSVEALSDSLLKLSTEEVQVNIIHKAVGQISESDVLLASASDAIVLGFQVRPSANARKLAEQEQIEIRLYSIIYDAINEVRDAMEGLLAPTTEEVIVGNIEVREVFKISKIGTVAGCYVTDGLIKRNNKIRVIRDFIVVHTGEISALKRFKDDVNEVRNGYECGMSIKNFNDLQVGDTIESFELKEVKRTL